VISSTEILDAGMTLYQFIASSQALISDFSSVWVEYLHLDRPLLLFCPDIAEYVEGRGLNPPYLTDIAPDLIVELTDDLSPFFDAVRRGKDWRPEARAALRTALRLPPPGTPIRSIASVVLEELGEAPGARTAPSPSKR
jgi:hypothetical protein